MDFETAGKQAARLTSFGKVPLLILSADPDVRSRGMTANAIAGRPAWEREQEALKSLSPLSWRVIARGSGHKIYRDRPDASLAEMSLLVRHRRLEARHPTKPSERGRGASSDTARQTVYHREQTLMREGLKAARASRRALAVCLAAVLLLLPGMPALGLLRGNGDCTMACCRGKGACCCRKPRAAGSAAPGPAWSAAPGCLNQDCGGLGIRSSGDLSFLAPQGVADRVCQLVGGVRVCRQPAVADSTYSELYQRPPPGDLA
jgi:hypothetical protein